MRPYSTTEARTIARLWSENATVESIATTLGRSQGSIKQFIRKNRAAYPARSMGHHRVKIDLDIAIRMRAERATLQDVADRFGMSVYGVQRALKRASA